MKKVIKILFIILMLIITIYFFDNFILAKFLNKHSLEKESIKFAENFENSPFSISKIIMFSSGYGENKDTNFQKTNWILDIFQYTDIALYISPSGDKLDSSNTIKKLSLENINISAPKLGTSSLYYLDSLNFGTSTTNENFKLDEKLEFTVLNDENANNEIHTNTPVFFTDCSNPITLKYVNKHIKKDFIVNSNEPIFFNGKLLEIADVDLNQLEAKINFTINIQSNDDKNYFYHLSLPICLENDKNSIFEGNILSENEYKDCKFYKKQL